MMHSGDAMVQAVRTTVTIDDDLLEPPGEPRASTGRSRRSVSSILEDALRDALQRAEQRRAAGPVVLPTVGGGGLRPGIDLNDKEQIAELLGDNELHLPQ